MKHKVETSNTRHSKAPMYFFIIYDQIPILTYYYY